MFVASVLDTVVCVANHLVALVLHVVILKVPPSIVDCKENQCRGDKGNVALVDASLFLHAATRNILYIRYKFPFSIQNGSGQ